jgi:hypothetical protein
MVTSPFGGAVYTTIAAQFAREDVTTSRILIVDPLHVIPPAIRSQIAAEVIITKGGDLTGDLLQDVRPDVVMVPLFGKGMDVFDLTAKLIELGYRGRIRAFSPPVPNARLICEEVGGRFPKLDFGIIEVPGRS